MGITVVQICDTALGGANDETFAVILAVVFGFYILFDCILGALTVGTKALGVLTNPPKDVTVSVEYGMKQP
tara:strand:- start:4343 stop:4555 length:213 start_codon:yes stop_codon:yes gene_type:complete